MLPDADMDYTKADFGKNFKWGVATASYQIEGAWNIDGKSPSIWDTFTHKKKTIRNGDNGDVACDFYHRYEDDIALVKEMNMDVFRFSLSWSRLLPNGTGAPNPKGVDFYHRVIDRCLELGVEPWITLYHWDLPQILEDKGGWPSRNILGWFEEYADFCTRTYGDKVKNWMVLNEPAGFCAAGYIAKYHAPGKRGLKKFTRALHHAAMCQAEGGRIIRANVPDSNTGTTLSCAHVEPKNDKKKHQKAAQRIDAVLNRLFIEPCLGMGYPVNDGAEKLLGRVEKHMLPGDEEKLKFDFDFIGLQNYTRTVARKSLFPPVLWANEHKPEKRGVPSDRITEMNWEVYPEGIYKILKQFAAYKNMPPIIVTENGASFPDFVTADGKIHDRRRKEYYQAYIANVLKAKRDGVDVRGYFAWTLMDNFEWAEGYHPRFGLVHVDFETQERRMKDSGLWFKEFLK